MENDFPGQNTPQNDGLTQRSLNKVGAHGVVDTTPEDTPGVPIPDGAQIRPLTPIGQISDIGESGQVDVPLVEVAAHQVRGRCRVLALDGGDRMPLTRGNALYSG